MKQLYYSFGILFITTLVYTEMKAQANESLSNIQIIAKSTDTGIILRWAPDRPLAWYISLQAGYKIERMELQNAKSSLADGKFITLVSILKPWPIDAWQPIAPPVTKDNNAAVAAQMIYGTNFKSQNDKNASFISKADELKNRFSYALLAADLSGNAAQASGLRYVDKALKKDHVYVYRVTSLAKSDLFEIVPSTIVVHEKNKIQISTPEISHISQGDRVVLSDDFKQDSLSTEYFVYQDSTESNYKNYYYRIIGITPFAEFSLPSATVMQYSIDKTPPQAPTQVKATQIGPDKIKIEWNHSGASDLKGFFVGHSFNPISDYNILHLSPLAPGTKYYIHDSVNTLKANHYIIAAVDTAGNASYSLNTYGHLVDSIPPAIPTGLKGKIDTSGKVYLSWNANKEPDIMGYAIHFSNDSTHVFAVVTNRPVLTNSYIDTIMIRTLTERIYYKIVAIDNSFNYSDLSPYIALQRPDIIPPSAPLFKEYIRDTSSITLHWINSTSKDVVKHNLYRKSVNSTVWTLIESQSKTKNTVSSFADKKVEDGTEYEYKIVAIDDAGLVSNSAFTYKIMTVAKNTPADIKDFLLTTEGNKATLTWKSSAPPKAHYIIYKAVDQGPFLAIDKSTTTSYVDIIKDNQKKIAYRVRIKYPDGKLSDYSNSKQF
jgi:fibronectin type 3 domain-containing protein